MKIKVLSAWILLLVSTSCTHQTKEDHMTIPDNMVQSGTVIILNGPSASGKSSIQKKIRELFDKPYLKLGIDNLFDAVLPDYYGLGMVQPKGSFSQEDIRYIETMEVRGKKAIKLIVGPIGRKVITGMHYSIAAYAKSGNNVVVDYILYEKEWFSELVNTLKGIKVYYVGLKYPLEIIEKREIKRATSPEGHARSHYDTVHSFDRYDLVIHDATLSAEEVARQIQKYMDKNPNPNAFRDYLKQFNSP